MANSIAGAVWAVDTAAAATVQSGVTYVTKIRWVGGSTAGHEARVTDVADRVVFHAIATGPNYTNETLYSAGIFPGALPVTNLKVPTLGSGTLYIEIAR